MENEHISFIEKEMIKDLEEGRVKKIVTRFPPEPNGYLHIGSAYAIRISSSLAKKYQGQFNLRFDDTNPVKEDARYVQGILEGIDFLGVDYGGEPFYGSDYAEQLFQYAKELVLKGKAYVCDLSQEEMREYRGTLTQGGRKSPYRDRSIEENLALFCAMREGIYEEGERVLRAKIDMESPNMNLRDPVIFRILKAHHYRTEDRWCIYPMYDFAHPLQDYLEGVTHSLCSNEFVSHRPLYNWVLENLDLSLPLPRQIEFGRLNITGVVTSKRYLKRLVAEGAVIGWDDPRLPTLQGLKRRGYTREAIFSFLDEIGIHKGESTVDVSMLEHALRQDLSSKVPSVMAVLDPIRVVLTNCEEGSFELLPAENNANNEGLGTRMVPFSRNLYIEREDFSENPPKKYNRLVLGEEVRLKHAYFIRCHEVIKNEAGEIVELHCTYDKETKSGSGFSARKVKGTIHWVSCDHAMACKVHLYEPLYLLPPLDENLIASINPHSFSCIEGAYIEEGVQGLLEKGSTHFQFLRHAYFVYDPQFTKEQGVTFNRIVSLKSSYRP